MNIRLLHFLDEGREPWGDQLGMEFVARTENPSRSLRDKAITMKEQLHQLVKAAFVRTDPFGNPHGLTLRVFFQNFSFKVHALTLKKEMVESR